MSGHLCTRHLLLTDEVLQSKDKLMLKTFNALTICYSECEEAHKM